MMRVRIMGKQTATDGVPHRDLAQVGFHVGSLTLTLTGKDGIRETLAIRLLVPQSVQGKCHFITDMIFRLRAMLERRTGEEHDFYQWVIRMLRFYLIYPELDPHRTRHFNLKTLDHSETLQELAALTQTKRLPKPERLIKFAGETIDPTRRLLRDATYIQPDLSIPLASPDYIAFREQCLSEMVWGLEQIEGMKRNALEQLRREFESDPKLSADQRAQELDKVASIEAGEVDAQLREVCQYAERCSDPIKLDHFRAFLTYETSHCFVVETTRVHLDLWYPGPPTKGGPRHGHVTVRRSPDPPHGGPGFDQSHRG
jgi:hypothetical protein